jgi:hypothetical protein
VADFQPIIDLKSFSENDSFLPATLTVFELTAKFLMTISPTSGLRQRTCRACGRKFDYPVKGGTATRHHCEDCVAVSAETRKILERLSSRVTQLENQLRRQQEKSAPPAA